AEGLSPMVGALDGDRLAGVFGEDPPAEDALGAGGDLEIRVERRDSFGVADVPVGLDLETQDHLLGGQRLGRDLATTSDLDAARGDWPVGLGELLVGEIRPPLR